MKFLQVFVVLLAPILVAAQYYVDPAAPDDSGDGSAESPWRVLKAHIDDPALAAGDTLNLLGGTFRKSNQGGQHAMLDWAFGTRILLRAYPGDNVTLEFGGLPTTGHRWIRNAVDGLVLEGFSVRNWRSESHSMTYWNDPNVTLRDIEFDNCYIDRDLGQGLLRFDGDGARLERLSFVSMPDSCGYYVYQRLCDGLEVIDCTFNAYADMADTLGVGGGILAILADSISIVNCRMYNLGHFADGSYYQPVDLKGCRDVFIEGLIQRRHRRGVQDPAHPLHDLNGLHMNQYSGIGCDRAVIRDCLLKGAGHGIQLAGRDCLISNVRADSTYDDGIFLYDPGGMIAGTGGNVIEDCVITMALDDGISTTTDSVTVRNCTIVRPDAFAFNLFAATDTISVTDCVMYDVGARASPHLVFLQSGMERLRFDRNVWWSPDPEERQFNNEGVSQDFAEWQASGYDEHGCMQDPLSGTELAAMQESGYVALGGPCTVVTGACCVDGDCSEATQVACVEQLGTYNGDGTSCTPGICEIVETTQEIPFHALSLAPVRPNPFRRWTTLHFSLPEKRRVSLHIFDAAGRLVRALVDEELRQAGPHRVTWSGRGRHGAEVAPGVYFVELRAGTARLVTKIARVP